MSESVKQGFVAVVSRRFVADMAGIAMRLGMCLVGWLMLGIDAQPDAAWNPIAGFTDGFGQLLWSAIGDPALFSAPYGSGWMLNRIADVQSNSGR